MSRQYSNGDVWGLYIYTLIVCIVTLIISQLNLIGAIISIAFGYLFVFYRLKTVHGTEVKKEVRN